VGEDSPPHAGASSVLTRRDDIDSVLRDRTMAVDARKADELHDVVDWLGDVIEGAGRARGGA
jgi:hypothetical protein